MTANIAGAVSPINATVAYSATSVSLFSLVRTSKYRSVVNNTDKKLYIFFSASAATTTTSNTRILASGETYQFPTPIYNNVVTAIGEAGGTGSWNTTEYS
jgi:hypothetical protein